MAIPGTRLRNQRLGKAPKYPLPIDPRLMKHSPITVMEPSNSTLSIGTSASSGGYSMTPIDLNLVETFERRVMRGGAKPANLEPVPRLESPP